MSKRQANCELSAGAKRPATVLSMIKRSLPQGGATPSVRIPPKAILGPTRSFISTKDESEYKPAPWSAGIFVLAQIGSDWYTLVSRSYGGRFSFLKGAPNGDETPEATAIREFSEEMGDQDVSGITRCVSERRRRKLSIPVRNSPNRTMYYFVHRMPESLTLEKARSMLRLDGVDREVDAKAWIPISADSDLSNIMTMNRNENLVGVNALTYPTTSLCEKGRTWTGLSS